MITITHTHDKYGPVSYASHPDTACLGIETTMYVTGYDPPHYPLPAIPLQCEWRSERQTHYRTLLFIKRAYTERIHAVAAWWQADSEVQAN